MLTKAAKPPIAVGCGAGFSGDRVDAPGPVVQTLIQRGGPCALIFETLAERTLASSHLARRADPERGFEPLLELALGPVLADCLAHGISVIGNFGAANPAGAARCIQRLAQQRGLAPPRIAVVEGDDLSAPDARDSLRDAIGDGFDAAGFVCANVYLGAFEIAAALKAGAQVVVTGRVADPALTLGPCIAHFGWEADDWNALAGGTMAGHLLECGAQVSGGYFADPGFKEVAGLENVGFPIAEVQADGSCVVGKADATGGLVDVRTVKEQLLYEIHDPGAYLTPDVVADLRHADVEPVGPNRVRLSGVVGHPRPQTLKVNAFFDGGWLGEAEISYAGAGAEARARLAMQVLQARMGPLLALRFDLIGVSSILGDDSNRRLAAAASGDARDVRLRVAARSSDGPLVDRLLREVTALWTGGPAGGGGVRTAKRLRLSMRSALIRRSAVRASFRMLEAA